MRSIFFDNVSMILWFLLPFTLLYIYFYTSSSSPWDHLGSWSGAHSAALTSVNTSIPVCIFTVAGEFGKSGEILSICKRCFSDTSLCVLGISGRVIWRNLILSCKFRACSCFPSQWTYSRHRNFLAHLEETCLKVLLGVEIKTLWHFSKSVSTMFLVENYNKISKDFEALWGTALPSYSRSLLLFLLLHCVYRPQLWSSSLRVRHHRNGFYVIILSTTTEHFSMERQERVAEATETCCDLCKVIAVIQWAAGIGP